MKTFRLGHSLMMSTVETYFPLLDENGWEICRLVMRPGSAKSQRALAQALVEKLNRKEPS